MNLHFFKPVADWLSFLAQAVPPRSRLTILELIVGAIIAKSGHITAAILALGTDRLHRNSYYKAIEEGKFQW